MIDSCGMVHGTKKIPLQNTPTATLKHSSMAHNSVTFVSVALNTVFCTFTVFVDDTCVTVFCTFTVYVDDTCVTVFCTFTVFVDETCMKFQSNNIRNVGEVFSFKLTTEKSLCLDFLGPMI